MKAVGLMSGGLDSTLAAKTINDLGIEVHAIFFCQPWIEKDPVKIRKLAQSINVHFHVIDLQQDYLDMLKNPQHGYGKAFNPCIDCHKFMVKKAGEFMREIGASFVFTGEVLGQRPMSQNKQALLLVEKGTGMEGYLLRPLCAKLMDETIPEQKGWVDRSKLLAISGRSRKEQLAMAEKFGIEGFAPTGGGCLITEKIFGAHTKDFLSWSYRNPQETVSLKWGRYFRLNEEYVAIVGRNQKENEMLSVYAHPDDHIVRLDDGAGPELLLKGNNPDEKMLALAGGIVQRYSKLRDEEPQKISYKRAPEEEFGRCVMAEKVSDDQLKTMMR